MAKRKPDMERLKIAEIRWECVRRNKKYQAEHKQLTEPDKCKNPFYSEILDGVRHTGMGMLGTATLLCNRWGLTYPKNPNKSFVRSKDLHLFNSLSPVRIHPTQSWQHKIGGAQEAIKRMRILVDERRLSFHEATEKLQQLYSQEEDRLFKTRNKNEITMVIDCSRSRREILQVIDDFFNKSGWCKITPKKRRRILSADHRLMFKAWDMEQKGKSHSQIARSLGENDDSMEVRTISDWCRRIDKMIDETTPK